MKKLILSIFLLLLILPYAAITKNKLKITTTIPPLASLIRMVAKDLAEIHVISLQNACIHSHSLLPSEIKQATNSDIFVYINDNFDGLNIKKFCNNSKALLELSQAPNLTLINNNWHIWMHPKNAEIIIEYIHKYLCRLLPSEKDHLYKNYQEAKRQLQNLYSQQYMIPKKRFIVLSESPEYLFLWLNANYLKHAHKKEYSSLNFISKLQRAVSKNQETYLIIDEEQDLEHYHTLFPNNPIIEINTENWKCWPSERGDCYIQMINGILDKLQE